MIHKAILIAVAVIMWPLRPATWRYLFLGKTKVRVYLSSGEHVDVLCKRWNVTFIANGCSHYKIEGMHKTVTFAIDSIIAMEER